MTLSVFTIPAFSLKTTVYQMEGSRLVRKRSSCTRYFGLGRVFSENS